MIRQSSLTSNAKSSDSLGQSFLYSKSTTPNSTVPLKIPSLLVGMITVGSVGTSGDVGSTGSVGVIGSVSSGVVGSIAVPLDGCSVSSCS